MAVEKSIFWMENPRKNRNSKNVFEPLVGEVLGNNPLTMAWRNVYFVVLSSSNAF